MAPALDDPRRGAVEAVVVAGREVDDDEERVVARLRAHAREAVAARRGGADADLGRHAHVLRDGLGERLVARHGRVRALAVLLRRRARARERDGARGHVDRGRGGAGGGGRGRPEEVVQAVFDAVDLGEVAVVDLLEVAVGELDGGRGGPAGARDAEQCIEGVCAALDLLNAAILDHAEVEHATVCRTDLEAHDTVSEMETA